MLGAAQFLRAETQAARAAVQALGRYIDKVVSFEDKALELLDEAHRCDHSARREQLPFGWQRAAGPAHDLLAWQHAPGPAQAVKLLQAAELATRSEAVAGSQVWQHAGPGLAKGQGRQSSNSTCPVHAPA